MEFLNVQNKQNIYLGCASAASGLLSIFGFICSAGSDKPAQRSLFIICSLLLLLLCGLYVYIIYLSYDREPNYFLYDRLAKRNLPASALSWQLIDERLEVYIKENLGGEGALWQPGILSADGKYGAGGIFRPLVAYKMLHDAASDGGGEHFRRFVTADASVIASLCRVLENAGDADMAKVILTYRTNSGQREGLYRYLAANQKYIRSRMLGFVRRHIEYFY